MVEDDEANKEKLAPATGTKRESNIKVASVQEKKEQEQKQKEGQ